MNEIQKAYEITDAKIQFVSLVDKAANKKAFLIAKADGSKAGLDTFGRILKADDENHYVTGIVYEPMVEDSQGNYMTEAEIVKAAYWFARHGNQVDLQHSFKPLDSVAVVESWVAKADFSLNGEDISQGTWLMTMEIQDPDIWNAVQSGQISGFSMGGIGTYSEEDTELTKNKRAVRKEDGLQGKDIERLVEIYEEIGEFLAGYRAPVAEACRDDDEVEKEKIPNPKKEDDEQAQTSDEPSGPPASEQSSAESGSETSPDDDSGKDDPDQEKKRSGISKQMVSDMIRKAVKTAMAPIEQEREELQQQEVLKEFIRQEVANVIKEYTQPKGNSKQLDPVEKQDSQPRHYLADIL